MSREYLDMKNNNEFWMKIFDLLIKNVRNIKGFIKNVSTFVTSFQNCTNNVV